MHAYAQPLAEDELGHAHVVLIDAEDADLAGSDCAKADVAAHLDMVGADRELAAVQPGDPFDHEDVAANAADPAAHLVDA